MKPQTHPYDRRHLKEVLHKNEFMDSVLEARDWAKAHLEAVLIGTLVLAAAVYGVIFFMNAQATKALQASTALNEAQGVFQQAGSLTGQDSVQAYTQAYAKYQAIQASYDGTPQALAARLGMANADLALGKGPEAEKEYAALDSRDGSSAISALAGLGRARALEIQGKGPAAQAAYADVLKTYPGSAVEAEAKAASERLAKSPPSASAAVPSSAPIAPMAAPQAVAPALAPAAAPAAVPTKK